MAGVRPLFLRSVQPFANRLLLVVAPLLVAPLGMLPALASLPTIAPLPSMPSLPPAAPLLAYLLLWAATLWGW